MLSIIIPVLDSHEILRRQVLHFKKMNLPDDVEIIIMDDGSVPPLEYTEWLKNYTIYPTYDTRPWTSSLARNKAAEFLAKGDYFLMVDVDYILPRKAIDAARVFTGDKMRFKREFGILDENGDFRQDIPTLLAWGLDPERVAKRGVRLPPHPNVFCMKREIFFEMGGYEDRVGRRYPLREDNAFKAVWTKRVIDGKSVEHPYRPTIYMFPNGQYCGDADYNPFGYFHTLSRKR
jgi:glycosyltransferase involved in cell wall biosynthesis